MMDVLIVFVIVYALDLVWALYTKAIGNGYSFVASLYAALIYILAGYSTISFVHNPWLIFVGAAGAVAGTYSALVCLPYIAALFKNKSFSRVNLS